jgi:phage tail-like protein
MQAGRDNFRYLNREGKWLNFHWSGLEVSPEGALRLLSSPRLATQTTASANAGPPPTAPTGVASDESGRVFFSIPEENRVVASGGCDPAQKSLTCLTESFGLDGLNKPRGLLVLSRPARLMVVDSGNDRLLFYDLVDFELREVWGGTGVNSVPNDTQVTDRFNDPWTVAADAAERNLYVLDAGNQRVLKFSRTGEMDRVFLERMRHCGAISNPGALAVCGSGSETRVFVSDLATNTIFVFDESGHQIVDKQGLPIAISVPGMGNILALAASNTTLYAGDNDQQRILSFALGNDFAFSGEAAGFRGFVTALAVDSRNQKLLVNSSAAPNPLVLDEHAAYLSFGFLWSDAIRAKAGPVSWNRLQASVTTATGAHVEFHYALSDTSAPPPVDPTADNPFQHAAWQTLPVDVEDFLLKDEPKPFLFVAARFFSDRTATPLLSQMRAEFDVESFMQYLPRIYREPALARVERPGELPSASPESDFLKRLVSLFQGLFEDVENEVDSLERYFDPYAAPAGALEWLATWLAVEPDLGEPESRIRESIARAFRRYQWRGTIRGLRLALLEDAGVHATITEPISAGTVWAMSTPAACSGEPTGSRALLGADTRLTSMEPGGAVIGSTAQLDHSYLITDAQFGEPVFAGVSNQFIVEVHRSEVSTEARRQLVMAIIDREKPAHTMYRLVVTDPSMRTGFQSRIGVDTVVSGQSGPTPLGQDGGDGLRLGGSFALRLGSSRLGDDLKL